MRLTFFVAQVVAHCPTVRQMITTLNEPTTPFRVVDVTTSTTEQIAQALRESDGILIEATILGASSNPHLFPHYLQLAHSLNGSHLVEVVRLLLEPDVPRLLVAADFDLHGPLGGGMTPEQIERFDGLAWDYVELPPGVEGVPGRLEEEWMHEGIPAIANWKNIRDDFPCQIEFPHAVSRTDIASRQARAMWDTCIPGQPYATRKLAASSARAAALSVAPFATTGRAVFKLTRPLGVLGLSGDRVRYRFQAMNQRFTVRHSRVCWVDGSAYGYFVRKFVEVPALATPMVTPRMPMLARLGFRTGITHIETDPDNFGNEARALRNNPQFAQTMGRAAREVVEKHHQWRQRLADLHRAARSVVAGDRRSWHYEEGALQPCSD